MYLFDRLLHHIPWNGDRIRLYQRDAESINVFIGEFYIKIKQGEVLVQDNTDIRYIRRDLPKWSSRFGCWEYWYGNGGE